MILTTNKDFRLKKLNRDCGRASGFPNYPYLDRQRRSLIREIESERVLSRWEYICLYGYSEWCEFIRENGLPENHSTAEEQPMTVTGGLEIVEETWEDPGDYPSGAGSGPLPSYQYAGEVTGEIHITIPGEVDIKAGTYSSVEELNHRVFELLEEEIPSGVTVSQWTVAVNDKTLTFHVSEFEACDWEPPDAPEDW